MRRVATAVMVVVLLGLVALGWVLDRVAPARSGAGDEVASPVVAAAGAWVCAAGDTAEGSTLEVVAAAPPDEGGRPAALTVTAFGDGRLLARSSSQVFPNSATATPVDQGAAAVGTLVRWWDVPAAVSRVWTVEAEAAPSGVVAGPCQSRTSDRWVVPGLATAGGAQSRLVLANPFAAAASVAIQLTTPDGTLSPQRLENVVVSGRSVVEIPLNDQAPERADLGAIVVARSGRVVVEAIQTFDAAIGGVEGTSLALAAPRPAESWTVPSVATGEDASGWIWVTNPSERPAALSLSLHTPSGGLVPEGLEEITVAPGSTRRIELGGLLGEDQPHAGITVSSDNAVPVVVSAATRFTAETEERTGVTVVLGTPVLDESWVLAPGPVEGRSVRVDLANPGAAPAVVDVTVWTGSGLERPEELTALRVPAGGSREVDLSPVLAGAGGPVAVFVTGRAGQVAAGLRSFAVEGRRDGVAFVGVPVGQFRTAPGGPPVRFSPHLPEHIGTPLGPEPAADPLLEQIEEDLEDPATPTERPSP